MASEHTSDRPLTFWPLKHFGMLEFFTEKNCLLMLDRTNEQFGLVYKSSRAVVTMAQFSNGDAVCFGAASAIVAYRAASGLRKTTKVVIQFADGQVDIYFADTGYAQSFLYVLKGLATNTFNIVEISANDAKNFERTNWSIAKTGYGEAKPPPCTSLCGPMSISLNRLWRTGEWSDLTVVAGAKEFAVHRSILCPQSHFFGAACRPEFREGQTGLIYLEEDEETIGTMLAEIYGVENTITGPIFASFSLKTEIEQETILATILKLFIATDKYGFEAVKIRAAEAFADRLPFMHDDWSIVNIAKGVDECCPDNDFGLRAIVLDHILTRLPTILDDDALLDELLVGKFMVKALLKILGNDIKAGRTPSGPTYSPTFVMETPSSTPPQALRKSLRLARRNANISP